MNTSALRALFDRARAAFPFGEWLAESAEHGHVRCLLDEWGAVESLDGVTAADASELLDAIRDLDEETVAEETGDEDMYAELQGALWAYEEELVARVDAMERLGLRPATARDVDPEPSDLETALTNAESARGGRVYFIEAVGTGRVKIGFTERSVDERRRALQTSSPYELRAVGSVPGSKVREKELHQRFAHLRVMPRAEWFHDAPELRSYIERGCQ